MPDLLLNLAYPLILAAAFVYAATVTVRHRRRTQKRLPPRHRTPLTEARRRLMEEVEADKQIRRETDRIIADAAEKYGPLYETPPAREHTDH